MNAWWQTNLPADSDDDVIEDLPRELAPCGTPSAYARHKSRGEPVDDACRDAYREWNRNRMRARRARAVA